MTAPSAGRRRSSLRLAALLVAAALSAVALLLALARWALDDLAAALAVGFAIARVGIFLAWRHHRAVRLDLRPKGSRSVPAALILAAVFGPVGLLYAAIVPGVLLIPVCVVLFTVSGGLGYYLVGMPVCVMAAGYCAVRRNRFVSGMPSSPPSF